MSTSSWTKFEILLVALRITRDCYVTITVVLSAISWYID